MERFRKRRRSVAALMAVVIVVAVGGWLVARPAGLPIDHDRAVSIAREFFASADAHGAGSTTSNVAVSSADLGSDASGRTVWKIQIDGEVTEAGGTSPAYGSAMWLSVDAETGAVTVVAQG